MFPGFFYGKILKIFQKFYRLKTEVFKNFPVFQNFYRTFHSEYGCPEHGQVYRPGPGPGPGMHFGSGSPGRGSGECPGGMHSTEAEIAPDCLFFRAVRQHFCKNRQPNFRNRSFQSQIRDMVPIPLQEMSLFSNDTAADILGYGLETVPWEVAGK